MIYPYHYFDQDPSEGTSQPAQILLDTSIRSDPSNPSSQGNDLTSSQSQSQTHSQPIVRSRTSSDTSTPSQADRISAIILDEEPAPPPAAAATTTTAASSKPTSLGLSRMAGTSSTRTLPTLGPSPNRFKTLSGATSTSGLPTLGGGGAPAIAFGNVGSSTLSQGNPSATTNTRPLGSLSSSASGRFNNLRGSASSRSLSTIASEGNASDSGRALSPLVGARSPNASGRFTFNNGPVSHSSPKGPAVLPAISAQTYPSSNNGSTGAPLAGRLFPMRELGTESLAITGVGSDDEGGKVVPPTRYIPPSSAIVLAQSYDKKVSGMTMANKNSTTNNSNLLSSDDDSDEEEDNDERTPISPSAAVRQAAKAKVKKAKAKAKAKKAKNRDQYVDDSQCFNWIVPISAIFLTLAILGAVITLISNPGILSGDDVIIDGTDGGSGGDDVPAGIACSTFEDCPRLDHQYDFCDFQYECRALLNECSEQIVVDPCRDFGASSTCDEATRTCSIPVGTMALASSINSTVDITRTQVNDQSDGDWDPANFIDLDGDDQPWVYTFDLSSVEVVASLKLDVNIRLSSSVPGGGGGTWYLYDFTTEEYSIQIGTTQSFYTSQWVSNVFPIVIPEGHSVTDPVSGEAYILFTFDNEYNHRVDFMQLEVSECEACSTCTDASCTGNTYCHAGSGQCLCSIGWEGDDCNTRRVPVFLEEDSTVYDMDEWGDIYDINVKILEKYGDVDPTYAEWSNFTWDNVLADQDYTDDWEPEVPCRFEVTSGPDGLAYASEQPSDEPNAIVRMRGEYSRNHVYPGFKVILEDDWLEPYGYENKWRRHDRINLVKAASDLTRIRHALFYNLFRDVPYLTSWRTNFARLTFTWPNGTDVPWGLVTVIEEGRDRWAKDHGITEDSDSENYCLWKTRGFYWTDLDGWDVNDPYAHDEADYDFSLGPKSCPDKSIHKITTATHAFMDYSNNIEDLVAEYVYLPNFFSWIATNMLLYDTDHSGKNHYLLATPETGSTIYWVPWDYDDALSTVRFPKDWSWEIGLGHYAISQYGTSQCLYYRIFRMYPGAMDQFLQIVEDLHDGPLSAAAVTERVNYLKTNLINDAPNDITDFPVSEVSWLDDLDEFVTNIDVYYTRLVDILDRPIGTPNVEAVLNSGTDYMIEWWEGYSPHGRNITYTLTIATDNAFASVFHYQTGIASTMDSEVDEALKQVNNGYWITFAASTTYYVKVETVDDTGQIALSGMHTTDSPCGDAEPGTMCFTTT